jgi:Asp-tRNA(Asn)/Glu-tRNA(Gln) amidotransferase C subunit
MVAAAAVFFRNQWRGLTILGMSDSSPVAPEVVRKVAALARLRVPEPDLPAWTRQLGRILSYIGQLEGHPERPERAEPPLTTTPFRADVAVPGGGKEALEENAPALVHGYGSVPRIVGSST